MLVLWLLIFEIRTNNITLGDWISFNNYSEEVIQTTYGAHEYSSHYGTPNGINTTKGLVITADQTHYAYVTTDSCPLFHFEPPFVNEILTTDSNLVLSMTQRCINLVDTSDFERDKTTSLKLDYMNMDQVETQLAVDNTTLYTCLVNEIHPTEGYPGPSFCCCPRDPDNTTLGIWEAFNNYSKEVIQVHFQNHNFTSQYGTPNNINTTKGLIIHSDPDKYAHVDTDNCPLFHFEPPFVNKQKSTFSELVLSMTQRCIHLVNTTDLQRNKTTSLKLDYMNLSQVESQLKADNTTLYTCLVSDIHLTNHYPGPSFCCCPRDPDNATLGRWETFNNYSKEVIKVHYQHHNFTSHYGTPNRINTTKQIQYLIQRGLIIHSDPDKYAHVDTDNCPLFHFEPPFVNKQKSTFSELVLSMTQRCIHLVNTTDLQRNKTTSLKLDYMNLSQVESQLKADNTTLYTCLVSDIHLTNHYPGPSFCCCPRDPDNTTLGDWETFNNYSKEVIKVHYQHHNFTSHYGTPNHINTTKGLIIHSGSNKYAHVDTDNCPLFHFEPPFVNKQKSTFTELVLSMTQRCIHLVNTTKFKRDKITSLKLNYMNLSQVESQLKVDNTTLYTCLVSDIRLTNRYPGPSFCCCPRDPDNTTLGVWKNFKNYSQQVIRVNYQNHNFTSYYGSPISSNAIKGLIINSDTNLYANVQTGNCPLFHFEPPFINKHKSNYTNLVLSMTQRCIHLVDNTTLQRNQTTSLKLDYMNVTQVQAQLASKNITQYTCLVSEIHPTMDYPGSSFCCCPKFLLNSTLENWLAFDNYSQQVKETNFKNHNYTSYFGTPNGSNNTKYNKYYTSRGLIIIADENKYAYVSTSSCPLYHFDPPFVNQLNTTNQTLVLSMTQRCINVVNNSKVERNQYTSLYLDFMNLNQVKAQLQNKNNSLYTCLVSEIHPIEGYPGSSFCCCPSLPENSTLGDWITFNNYSKQVKQTKFKNHIYTSFYGTPNGSNTTKGLIITVDSSKHAYVSTATCPLFHFEPPYVNQKLTTDKELVLSMTQRCIHLVNASIFDQNENTSLNLDFMNLTQVKAQLQNKNTSLYTCLVSEIFPVKSYPGPSFCCCQNLSIPANTTLGNWTQYKKYSKEVLQVRYHNHTYTSHYGTPNDSNTTKGLIITANFNDSSHHAFVSTEFCPLFHFEPPFVNENKTTNESLVFSMTQRCINQVHYTKAEENRNTSLRLDIMNLTQVRHQIYSENISLYTCLVSEIHPDMSYPGSRFCCCPTNHIPANTTLGNWTAYSNFKKEVLKVKYQKHVFTSFYGTPNGSNNTKGLVITSDSKLHAYVTTATCPLFHFEPPFVNEQKTTAKSLVLSMTQRCINLVNITKFQRNHTTHLKLDYMNLSQVQTQLISENISLYTCLVNEIHLNKSYPGASFCCCPDEENPVNTTIANWTAFSNFSKKMQTAYFHNHTYFYQYGTPIGVKTVKELIITADTKYHSYVSTATCPLFHFEPPFVNERKTTNSTLVLSMTQRCINIVNTRENLRTKDTSLNLDFMNLAQVKAQLQNQNTSLYTCLVKEIHQTNLTYPGSSFCCCPGIHPYIFNIGSFEVDDSAVAAMIFVPVLMFSTIIVGISVCLYLDSSQLKYEFA